MSSPIRPRPRRLLVSAACLVLLSGATAAVGSATAQAADPGSTFTAGDVVVYRVGDGTSTLSGAGTPVFLDEYSPAGALVRSVALPTTADGANKPLVSSGSGTSEGGLTLSADSNYLVATGYDTAVGTTGLSSTAAATVPRTIARVDASGSVDTTTALTDFADGNNPRSAVSNDGQEFWVGGAAGGVRYAALGASTSTSLVASTYKNVRQLAIADGQLYTSADPTKASVTVATVGTGLPTTATQPVTNLPFAASAPTGPYSYSLLTLGSGSTPDTLYVADNALNAIVKYGLENGSWVQLGSAPVPSVTGLTANDNNGTVTLYATSSGSAGTAGTLYQLTDASGTGGTLTGTATALASTPANEAFRGVAYAPGTAIGSGGGGTGGGAPATVPPTITTLRSGLPAALGDPTNATLPISVGDTDPSVSSADQLTVTVSSSDPTVAPASGISVTGAGADRTLTVTPAAVGYSTLTLTVSAPDGTSSSTQIQYGVSADLGDPSQRYFSGAGNASAAIDVGGGYMLVADDESNVLRLYDETRSGPPVRSFDFTGVLPAGMDEADLESAARVGDTIYWGGSMSNNSSGAVESSRSTIFATTITGSGADTQLSYVGGYTGLQSDLTAWDHANGHGLGADYLGLTASVQSGIGGHESDALNVEGMEFAPGSSSTAYLAFRAPLEPTTDRHLALIVPVTNMDKLAADNSGSVHATFGAPILMDLGGLGIRDIRKNADGQYLIIAGTADGTNDPFVLYTWDGQRNDPPLPTGTTLPIEPGDGNQGSWETVVGVPDPLTAGAPLQLLQDSGDTAWYGDTHTSKSGLAPDLMKDLGQVFSYTPGTPLGTTTTLSTPAAPGAGQPVTYTATVHAPTGTLGTPGGTVTFSSGTGTSAVGCTAVPVDATGTASCTVSYPATGNATMTASYSGDDSFAVSSASTTVPVRIATSVAVEVQPGTPVAGQPAVITVGVSSSRSLALLLAGGKVTLTVTDASGAAVPCTGLLLPGLGGVCAVLPGQLSAAKGPYRVTASFAGNALFAASSASTTFTVTAKR
jgi:hypothetical protein